MCKDFSERKRWLLGSVDNWRTFMIAPASSIKTTRPREIVSVFASGEAVGDQMNMPWSIRISSSSTAPGSSVRI